MSMFKSYLWLGSASLPSQTCAHHGGETDTHGETDTDIGDIREYFCNNAYFLYDTISPRSRIFQEMEKGIFVSTIVVSVYMQ